jgi:large conductance mechanosensitive channel
MKKLLNDFKKFISRGNVLDLAVAVVIGAAFTKITSSFVADIITPLLSLVLNKVNLSELAIKFNENVYLTYGNFIQVILDFLVISFSIFFALKIIVNIRERSEKSKAKIIELTKKQISKMGLTKKEEQTLSKLETKQIKKQEQEKSEPTKTELLLEEIRDLLKKNEENRENIKKRGKKQ